VNVARLHHLDALRALAMVLILPAHALALIGMRGGWNDVEASVFWTIHVFRLPLFFFVAGFFAALLLHARGVAGLLRNRGIRIGVPLAIGTVAVVPLLSLELQAVSDTHRPGIDGLGAFVNPHPSFLWFLWYLVLIYAGALLVRRLLAAAPAVGETLKAAGGGLLAHRFAPILLALPTAALLYRQPTWIAEAPAESFLPRLDLLSYYACFFAFGWLLFAVPGLREQIECKPGRYLILGAVALPPALALYLLQSEPAIGASRWFHLLTLLLLSIATWSLVLGLLGIARRLLHRPSPRLRYWADASYWIYLSHFPVMGAIALVLFELRMPDAPCLAILVGLTLALIYPAYGAFVRHTAIGEVLHGPRPRLVRGVPVRIAARLPGAPAPATASVTRRGRAAARRA
jgi:glucans biosynthesis protein C